MVKCRECWWMRYRPRGYIECRRLSRPLKEVDVEIQCSAFKAKEKDLEKVMRSTERYYQEIGREYNELWYSQRTRTQYKKFYSLLQRKIAQLLSHGTLILDAGCGTGEWATFIIKRGGLVVGFDQSSKMLQVFKEKSVSQGSAKNLNLVRGNLSLLPFKERTFDGVMTIFVLSHLPDDKMSIFLDELARVAKREGWMLFADTRLCEPHQRQEFVVRTLKSGREYVVFKRFFTGVELESLLKKQLSRSFSALELDRYVICISSPEARRTDKREVMVGDSFS